MVSAPLIKRPAVSEMSSQACPVRADTAHDTQNAYSHWVSGLYPMEALDLCILGFVKSIFQKECFLFEVVPQRGKGTNFSCSYASLTCSVIMSVPNAMR